MNNNKKRAVDELWELYNNGLISESTFKQKLIELKANKNEN